MEKRTKSDGVILTNKEAVQQKIERVENAKALINANKEVALHKIDKDKRAAELVIANKEVAFEKVEKSKRAAELLIANKELIFQNAEKEKRAAELLIANEELRFQNQEKEKRAAELVIANKELILQGVEKEKRASELNLAYQELKKAEVYLTEYIDGLEEMMFITSHKVRQPVANILGLTSMLDQFLNSPENLKKMVDYLRVSAISLDGFIGELTIFISDLEEKGRNNISFIDYGSTDFGLDMYSPQSSK